jgi:acyl transferase domain-containing protein/acyl carrier protein
MTGKQQDIAVIGIALKTALADNTGQFWQNLVQGRDCVHSVPEVRQQDSDNYLPHLYKIKIDEAARRNKKRYLNAGYLKDIDQFDYRFFRMSPKEASLLDPAQRVFLEVAYHVMEDAGYAGNNAYGSTTGVYAGYSDDVKLNYFQMISQLEPESIPVAIAGNLSSIVPTRISYFMNLKGPGIMVDTACSSSLVAVHLACQGIRNGDCDQAIAGGVRLNLFPIAHTAKIGIESSDGRTRTFDDASDGAGTGEGAGAVLLKPLEQAVKDGDHIYSVIKGSAINQDGHSQGITAPSAEAQAEVLIKAWQNAEIHPETLSFIEAHGTATRVGDPTEIEAIIGAFEQFTNKKQFCAIGSVKTNIGHLFEASGIFGLIKAALSLKYRTLPPILHFNRPNRNIAFETSPVYINDQLRQWDNNGQTLRCGVTAFGFSGTNCHVVLESLQQGQGEAPLGSPITLRVESSKHLLCISAKSRLALMGLVRAYKDYFKDNVHVSLMDICFTAAVGRSHFNVRLGVTAHNHEEMKTKLESFLHDVGEGSGYHNPELGLFYGESNNNENIKLDSSRLQDTVDLASQYVTGGQMDWTAFYADKTCSRVPLPLYAFDRNRCWLEVPEYKDQSAKPLQGKRFFDMEWIQDALPHTELDKETTASAESKGITLVIRDDAGYADQLITNMKDKSVVQVTIGTPFACISPYHYCLDGSESQYEKLLLAIEGRAIERVLFLATLMQSDGMNSLRGLQRSQKRGAYNLFHLTKMMLKHHSTEKIEYIVIADHVNSVFPDEQRLKPENASLFGLAYAIDQECENITTRCIDLDESISMEQLSAELAAKKQYRLSAYRNNQRYIERFAPVEIQEAADQKVTIKSEGVYLITGGTGGIGLEMGKYLATQKKGVNIALVNRSVMPDPSLWDEILYEEEDKRTCRKIAAIRDMESLGATVRLYNADCGNRVQMKQVLEDLRQRFDKLNGIIHGAGVEGEGLLVRKSERKFTNVINPKVMGTWILDRLTRDDELDFMVLFSTVATFLMNPGQTDYTAGNAFLDTFSAYRNRQGKKTLAVNWVTWKETGMAVNFNANFDIIFKAIPTAMAIDAFNVVLSKKLDRVLVGELNLESKLINLLKNAQFRLAAPFRAIIDTPDLMGKSHTADEQRKKIRKVKLTGGKDGNYSKSELLVARVWGEVLGFDELKIEDNFYELGGDSILATQVVNRINTENNLKISLIEIFNYETIKDLAEYVDSKQ